MPCEWMLIDGSSLIFRAFHGVPATVRTPDGRPINAVRGFLETLTRLVQARQPARLAVAADDDWRPEWRVQLIPSYKAHRTAEPVPAALVPQMPIIDSLLDAVGVDRGGVADYEAEDVIATWAAAVTGRVEVVSGDRDLFALIEDGRVLVLYPERGGLAEITEAEVARRYGIPGRAYADFAILRGDPSDGLPGLRGVGAVAAGAMVRAHGSIAGVLESGRLSAAQREYVERAVRVVHPVADLPIALPPGRRARYPVDLGTVAALSDAHGLGSTVGRLVDALNLRLARHAPPADASTPTSG